MTKQNTQANKNPLPFEIAPIGPEAVSSDLEAAAALQWTSCVCRGPVLCEEVVQL